MSRGGGIGLTLGGHAVVCCVHGRDKRSVTELEFDTRTEKPELCICCENVFTSPSGEARVCPACTPLPREGETNERKRPGAL